MNRCEVIGTVAVCAEQREDLAERVQDDYVRLGDGLVLDDFHKVQPITRLRKSETPRVLEDLRVHAELDQVADQGRSAIVVQVDDGRRAAVIEYRRHSGQAQPRLTALG